VPQTAAGQSPKLALAAEKPQRDACPSANLAWPLTPVLTSTNTAAEAPANSGGAAEQGPVRQLLPGTVRTCRQRLNFENGGWFTTKPFLLEGAGSPGASTLLLWRAAQRLVPWLKTMTVRRGPSAKEATVRSATTAAKSMLPIPICPILALILINGEMGGLGLSWCYGRTLRSAQDT